MAFYKSCSYLHCNSNLFTTANTKWTKKYLFFHKIEGLSLEQCLNITYGDLSEKYRPTPLHPQTRVTMIKHTTSMFRNVRMKDIIMFNENTLYEDFKDLINASFYHESYSLSYFQFFSIFFIVVQNQDLFS